jgi:SAM-dependent methyltransferase
MHPYQAAFARFYDAHLSDHMRAIGLAIARFHRDTGVAPEDCTLLDIGCGTGRLMESLLAERYRAIGIDLSPAMLDVAADCLADAISHGRARLIAGDATDFSLDDQVDLVAATRDVMNHLGGLDAFSRCLRCSANALRPGGWFIFDLLTHRGLEGWNDCYIQDNRAFMCVSRGVYDAERREAIGMFSGYHCGPSGIERFEQVVREVAYTLPEIQETLALAGFGRWHFAALGDLARPIPNPEREHRIFVVARL